MRLTTVEETMLPDSWQGEGHCHGRSPSRHDGIVHAAADQVQSTLSSEVRQRDAIH